MNQWGMRWQEPAKMGGYEGNRREKYMALLQRKINHNKENQRRKK